MLSPHPPSICLMKDLAIITARMHADTHTHIQALVNYVCIYKWLPNLWGKAKKNEKKTRMGIGIERAREQNFSLKVYESVSSLLGWMNDEIVSGTVFSVACCQQASTRIC